MDQKYTKDIKTQIMNYVNWINQAGLLERDKSDFHFGGNLD